MAEDLHAVGSVPGVATCGPGQRGGEGLDQVIEAPGQHHDVVGVAVEDDHHGGVAQAFEQGTDVPDVDAAGLHELAQRDLQEENGDSSNQGDQDVGNKEHTSTVLVAEVGEAPHVAQAHGEAHARHDEVHLARPGLARRHGQAAAGCPQARGAVALGRGPVGPGRDEGALLLVAGHAIDAVLGALLRHGPGGPHGRSRGQQQRQRQRRPGLREPDGAAAMGE